MNAVCIWGERWVVRMQVWQLDFDTDRSQQTSHGMAWNCGNLPWKLLRFFFLLYLCWPLVTLTCLQTPHPLYPTIQQAKRGILEPWGETSDPAFGTQIYLIYYSCKTNAIGQKCVTWFVANSILFSFYALNHL